MNPGERVRAVYRCLDEFDPAGVLALLAPEAKIFIPGATTISGDHEGDERMRVLERMAGFVPAVRRDLLDFKEGPGGFAVVVHDYIGEHGYHAVHDWEVRDGQLAYWWWYVHEYDEFEAAWR